ncbi:putative mitochondrial protein AtMg00310 [Apium graveolens]|uniref:putative mitochondrial protein AtMg00310 n=1 Tax=Apium graveolens TaxID=4045 RepID=UPI003D7A5203
MSKHKYEGGLGFRCLRDFNMAMMGKQCWRLLTNPDSLVARVYKARYYADKDFMEVELGNSPSFIWRCVWEAKKVISSGSCWRIGNGKNVSILQHPWLQNVENPYIIMNSPAIAQKKMASLFRTDAKQWDIEIIQDIFEE